MESYLLYIGKAALATGAFYLAFLVLFQNRKQFVFNRLYLPVSLAVSFVIPLITFTTIKYIEPETSVDFSGFAYLAETGETPQPAFVPEWSYYLFVLYILGATGFLFHLLLGHLKAMHIIRHSRVQKFFASKVNITPKEVHPFSFFSKIVISEKTLSHPNLDIIVSHENIHVREKHTLDILFTEILFLLQWFNPFAWLIRDAVKNNLEYKTDHQIVQQFHPQTYQLAMVSLADKEGVAPFLTALNGSQLKNRIIMMKKKTENKFAVVKQLVVLPLVAVLVMGLSGREVTFKTIPPEKGNKTGTEVLSAVQNKKTVTGRVAGKNGAPMAGVAVLIKGTTTGTITDQWGNYRIELPSENETLVFSMKDYKKEEIGVNGQHEIQVQLQPEGTTGGNQSSATQIPATQTEAAAEGTPGTDNHIRVKTYGNAPQPLYVVDGVETENIDTLDSENIEKIDVLKEKSATDLYGEKGKNGVILITTKSNSYINTPNNRSGQQKQGFLMPEEMPEFPGGETALKKSLADGIKYPESASENGIQGKVYVKFTITKEGNVTDAQIARGVDPALDKEAVRVVSSLPRWKPGKEDGEPVDVINYTVPVDFVLSGFPSKIKNVAGTATSIPKNALYVIDGKEYQGDINDINPDTFDSVTVLKGENATGKYGEKGKNGVIELTSKKQENAGQINSSLDLRKFIAYNIKYPVKAQENNVQATVDLWAVVEHDGEITHIYEKRPSGNVVNIDEVVVVGYSIQKKDKAGAEEKMVEQSPAPEAGNTTDSDLKSLLLKEAKRVVDKCPAINMPELKGKTVMFRIKFMLQ
jgi:TonB family protein